MFIRVGGAYKQCCEGLFVKVSGEYYYVCELHKKLAGVWKELDLTCPGVGVQNFSIKYAGRIDAIPQISSLDFDESIAKGTALIISDNAYVSSNASAAQGIHDAFAVTSSSPQISHSIITKSYINMPILIIDYGMELKEVAASPIVGSSETATCAHQIETKIEIS